MFINSWNSLVWKEALQQAHTRSIDKAKLKVGLNLQIRPGCSAISMANQPENFWTAV